MGVTTPRASHVHKSPLKDAVVIFPLISAVLAFLCAWVLGRDAARRPRADKVIWTLAFLMFGLAAAADAIGREVGWTTWLAKLYYATGPALVVMYLAIGELYLVAPSRMKRVGFGLTAILTAFWLSLVVNAPVDQARLAADGWDAIKRDGFMTTVTILINTISTLIIVGGTAWSIWRFRKLGIMRNRMIGCTWILAGTLFVATGGSLTRLGHYEYLYIAMSIGIAMIFYGVLCTRRPDGQPLPSLSLQGLRDFVDRQGGVPSITSSRRGNSAPVAFVAGLLEEEPSTISARCAEWSVPRDDSSPLSREEARMLWQFRQELPAASQQRFDALPVAVRRQVATLWHEVLTWHGSRDSSAAENGLASETTFRRVTVSG